jgi:hypothetical protein
MTDGSTLIFGEVHTGLLQHSTALSPSSCEEVLALSRSERVRRFERPIAHAVSPETLTGVDCGLPVPASRARAVGTVACRTSITGGQILQGSALVRLTPSAVTHRLPWSHYLARPGRVEVIGKVDIPELAEQFVHPEHPATALDVRAISARAVDAVQASRRLDRRPPLRAARTRLRWAAILADHPSADVIRFRTENPTLRTALLSCSRAEVASVVEFCEDFALHDWLLTTLLRTLERSRIGVSAGPDAVRALRPAVDHLLHLWMPGARGTEVSAGLWQRLERRPGLNRQWQVSVERIRDQMALTTIGLLEALLGGSGGRA